MRGRKSCVYNIYKRYVRARIISVKTTRYDIYNGPLTLYLLFYFVFFLRSLYRFPVFICSGARDRFTGRRRRTAAV